MTIAKKVMREPSRLSQQIAFTVIALGISIFQKDDVATVIWGLSLLVSVTITFIWWKHDSTTMKATMKHREEVLEAFK